MKEKQNVVDHSNLQQIDKHMMKAQAVLILSWGMLLVQRISMNLDSSVPTFFSPA